MNNVEMGVQSGPPEEENDGWQDYRDAVFGGNEEEAERLWNEHLEEKSQSEE